MRIRENILQLDVRVEDRYRKWFSTLGQDGCLAATCVVLGDSDIDYELAPNIDQTRVVSTPYHVEGIKHKLIYNGVGKNLAGQIVCFARKVDDLGNVYSIYDYPTNEVFAAGVIPPTLANGKNWERVTFTDAKMGFILYFSTVLDYYLDDDGVKKRLVETYDFSFDWDGGAKPAGWDYVIDNDNGSILIAKEETSGSPVGTAFNAVVTVVGQDSQKIKKLRFNI